MVVYVVEVGIGSRRIASLIAGGKELNMGRFSMLAEPIPAGAEVYRSLKIVRTETARGAIVRVWRAKQSRPYANYIFKNSDQREAWIEREKLAEDSRASYKAERDEAAKVRKAQYLESLQVGTLLYTSWGYEQTNVDFFQVVERRGSLVVMRQIDAVEVEGSAGFMSNRVKPVRDAFLDGKPPIRAIITKNGVSVDGHPASPTSEDSSHYQSWYA